MTLTLYHGPLACSLACRFALAELAIPHELIVLDLAAGAARTPEFLRLNPSGRVPALVAEAGTLTENVAILSYLANLTPDAGLMPNDPWARAKALSWLAWLSSTVHAAYSRALRPERFGGLETSAGIRESAIVVLTDAFDRLNALLAAREHLLGYFSICDLYLLVFALWRRSPVLADNLPDWGHVDAWQARMMMRPAVAECVADDMHRFAAQARERTA